MYMHAPLYMYVYVRLRPGGLYYFRKPIPFCGACLYASDFLSVPPPPPRPQASSVGPPKSPPPPTGAV